MAHHRIGSRTSTTCAAIHTKTSTNKPQTKHNQRERTRSRCEEPAKQQRDAHKKHETRQRKSCAQINEQNPNEHIATHTYLELRLPRFAALFTRRPICTNRTISSDKTERQWRSPSNYKVCASRCTNVRVCDHGRPIVRCSKLR